MPESFPDMGTLVQMLKTNFLDNHNIGIRRFAEMTRISRSRLQKFFDGTKFPTEDEVIRISIATDLIVAESKKAKELKEKKVIKAEIDKIIDEAIKGNG